jgi:hypothetical protein
MVEIAEIEIRELLADPVRFDGKTVAVVGWFIYEREHIAIYASRADSKLFPRCGLWVVHPSTVGGEDAISALSRGWVRLIGTFANRRKNGCGHFNAYPAQISNIKELEKSA